MFQHSCWSQGTWANLGSLSVFLEGHLQILKETERPRERLRVETTLVNRPAVQKRQTVFKVASRADYWDAPVKEYDEEYYHHCSDEEDEEEVRHMLVSKNASQGRNIKQTFSSQLFVRTESRAANTTTATIETRDKVTMSKSWPLWCPLCRKDHSILYCHQFLSSSMAQRHKTVMECKLCALCLKAGHFARLLLTTKT